MKKGLQLTLLGLSAFIFSCQKDAAKNDVSSPAASASSASSSALVKNSPFNLLPNSTTRGGGGEDGGGGDPCKSCTVTYPDSSNLPRSLAVFSESDVLVAATPGPLTCGAAPVDIKAWYSDEHALTLGIRQVIVKNSNGTTSTTNYNVAPSATTSAGASVNYPGVGTTIQSGDQTGNDVTVGGGRPCWPIMYITDLTGNPFSRSGDWQQGGIGVNPGKIIGQWKAAVRTVDKTHNPALVTINPDADPVKNNLNLPGGDAFPAGFHSEGYSAEVIWHVADLGLLPGHTYRLEFMVHDGDQNKAGGDAGEACTVIVMPGTITHPGD